MSSDYLKEQRVYIEHAYLDAHGLSHILKEYPEYHAKLVSVRDELVNLLDIGEAIIDLAEGSNVREELLDKIREIYPKKDYNGLL